MMNLKLDKIGMGLSITCLIHCLILPVLLATVPFIAFMSFMTTPLAETSMIIFAIFNAVLAVTSGFKKHKNMAVLALFLSGSILLALNFIAHNFVKSNEYVITIGAFLIGAGHLINQIFCKKCTTCYNNHE